MLFSLWHFLIGDINSNSIYTIWFLYKLILIGNRNFEINIYDIYKYEINKKIIKIKDNTKIKIDIEELSNENTLIGLFVRQLNEKIRQTDDNEKIKILEKAIEIGIEALKD